MRSAIVVFPLRVPPQIPMTNPSFNVVLQGCFPGKMRRRADILSSPAPAHSKVAKTSGTPHYRFFFLVFFLALRSSMTA